MPDETMEGLSETAQANGSADPAKVDPARVDNHVSYETHRRLLNEKKKLQEEFAAAQTALKDREEKELREKEDFKTLLALREKELKTLQSKVDISEQQKSEAVKLDSFLKSLDGQVDSKFWGHVDLSQIIVDPTTGQVDEMTVLKEVERFKKTFPEIIQRKGQAKVPATSPDYTSTNTISYEEWVKLPTKEMKARMKEVINRDKTKI